jgi:hypothetical protein
VCVCVWFFICLSPVIHIIKRVELKKPFFIVTILYACTPCVLPDQPWHNFMESLTIHTFLYVTRVALISLQFVHVPYFHYL